MNITMHTDTHKLSFHNNFFLNFYKLTNQSQSEYSGPTPLCFITDWLIQFYIFFILISYIKRPHCPATRHSSPLLIIKGEVDTERLGMVQFITEITTIFIQLHQNGLLKSRNNLHSVWDINFKLSIKFLKKWWIIYWYLCIYLYITTLIHLYRVPYTRNERNKC